MSEAEPTPPVLYGLWNKTFGLYIDTGNSRPMVTTDREDAEVWATLLNGRFTIVTLTPSFEEVRGE